MSSDVSSSTSSVPPFRREAAFVDRPGQFDAYEFPDREDQLQRAKALLVNRLGTEDASIATAYACGTVGVQADQTHYSDGFGLLMPLGQGMAAAARPADTSRVVFEGRNRIWTAEASGSPPWVTAVHRVLHELLAAQPVEVAIVSTIPAVCRDGYFAALAVCLMRVVRFLDVPTAVNLGQIRSLRDDLLPLLAGEVSAVTDRPYGTAYLLAAFAGREPAFTLVDTTTREYLPVETAARTALQWAVVDPRTPEPRSADFERRRQEQAEEALGDLRANGFEGLEAFRDLEHRDLERAVEVVPDALRPVVRHLVTENGRVQKHVAAMRRSDWQMIGALLLMSHASRRDDWKGTNAAVDAVVAEAETRTHDGFYGACMADRSGAVLVAGRPSVFGQRLGDLVDALEPVLGHSPRILRP